MGTRRVRTLSTSGRSLSPGYLQRLARSDDTDGRRRAAHRQDDVYTVAQERKPLGRPPPDVEDFTPKLVWSSATIAERIPT